MTDFEVRVKKFREERNATWAEFLSLSAEAGYTIEDSLANRSLFMSGYESGKEAGRVREAFEKGRASVPRWTRVEDGLPERRPNVAYSCVRCLVTRKGFVSILCFNHEHEVWDDEECDDYECGIYEVEAWMPLPQPYHGGHR